MPVLEPKIPEFKISMKMKAKPSELYQIKSSLDIAEVARKCFNADQLEWTETFLVVALNQANRVTGFYKVSSGGITGTVADPRVIYQFAILAAATSIIIAHNHPSGNLKPSKADEELTRKIVSAGQLFDIKVLDHVIITSEGYYSFSDEGIL